MTELTTAIQAIEAAETLGLRHRVLRPQQSLEDCAYPLDTAPESCHLGCVMGGDLVGGASVYHEAPVGEDDPHAWRLRGMAVLEGARGFGIGQQLLAAIVDYVAGRNGAAVLWCNARVSATGFYEAAGFAARGEGFDLPPLGPHVILSRRLSDG
jgi:GNAT superfamily N-acetyltransferase